METEVWSIDSKMKFELCRRSYSPAIGFLLVSSVLFAFPLPTSSDCQNAFRFLCVCLFLISVARLKHSLLIKKNGLNEFSKHYPLHVLFYCATPVIYSAMLIVTYIDPAVDQGALFVSHLSIVSLAAASASSAAFVPRIQMFFLFFIVVVPVTFLVYLHLNSNLALQVVPAMMISFIVYVFGNSQNFYRGMVKRFESENALILQKENLDKMYATLQEVRHEMFAQKAKADYASKMASLGQMAGGVAHEINNPLTTIRLHSELIKFALANDFVINERIDRSAQKIQETTERIAEIIRGLLSFSREGSKDPFQPFCINDTIEQTLSFCRERFKVAGIDFESENLTSVKIDGRSVQISQVLLNLLNNSFDAVKEQKDPKIKLAMKDIGSHVQITVEDNGKGIDSDCYDKLFQPFFTTKPHGQGTGLGLSVSHGIIKDHGGILQLDTGSDKTKFLFTLPKSTELVQTLEA